MAKKKSAEAVGAVGMAASQDGISWSKDSGNPVMTVSTIDSDFIAGPYVIQIGTSYKMWYVCRNMLFKNDVICYATSDDGRTWLKYSSPVLTPSTDPTKWDSGWLYSPCVIYDGTTYGMWYSAQMAGQILRAR